MVRTQLFLAKATLARLRARARRQGRTVSDLVREPIDLAFRLSTDADQRSAAPAAYGRGEVRPQPLRQRQHHLPVRYRRQQLVGQHAYSGEDCGRLGRWGECPVPGRPGRLSP